TSSSACASRTSSATRRCATCTGSNVPPSTPIPPVRGRPVWPDVRPDVRLLADLAVATHLVLVRRELAEPHRPARVQPVRADPDLRAEAELKAIGEAGGGVHED